MAIHKIDGNAPMVIYPKYADVADGNYGPQLKIKGRIEGIQDDNAIIYLPGPSIEKIDGLGVWRNGNREGSWVFNQGVKLHISKVGKVYQIAADGKPPVGSGQAAASQAGRQQGAAQPHGTAAAEPPGVTMQRVGITMRRCLEVARGHVADVCGRKVSELKVEEWAPTAHTMFIQLTRMGVLAPAPAPMANEQQLAKIEKLLTELSLTTDAQIAGACEKYGGSDPRRLSVKQADALIDDLSARVEELMAGAPDSPQETMDIPF